MSEADSHPRSQAHVDERVSRYAEPRERKGIAAGINPETAWFFFVYRPVLDPYGELELNEEEYCVGRTYFAIDPAHGIAVADRDWPPQLQSAFKRRYRPRLIWE